MPELPDLAVYLEALERRVVGRALLRVRLASPFVLRTAEPLLRAVETKKVVRLSRMGKRIVLHLDDDLFLVVHLMISGRFQWKDEPNAKVPGRLGLAAFDFESGTLLLTEASSKKRASLHLVSGAASLATFDRGGLEVLDSTLAQFMERLRSKNHTLKRSLTDPRLFSGIGNAYSDEILHAAKLSPVKLSSRMTDAEVKQLYTATKKMLTYWTKLLRKQVGEGFPEKVTAFRPEMAVHGKYGQPCPVCETKVQRIVHADNETNYCPGCQTEGKLLADRSLSKLLKDDWPKTLEEMEERKMTAGPKLG